MLSREGERYLAIAEMILISGKRRDEERNPIRDGDEERDTVRVEISGKMERWGGLSSKRTGSRYIFDKGRCLEEYQAGYRDQEEFQAGYTVEIKRNIKQDIEIKRNI